VGGLSVSGCVPRAQYVKLQNQNEKLEERVKRLDAKADAQVAAALGQVRSYLLSDGKLHLSLEADGGIMHWQPSTAAG
jgi:hypothetical protein